MTQKQLPTYLIDLATSAQVDAERLSAIAGLARLHTAESKQALQRIITAQTDSQSTVLALRGFAPRSVADINHAFPVLSAALSQLRDASAIEECLLGLQYTARLCPVMDPRQHAISALLLDVVRDGTQASNTRKKALDGFKYTVNTEAVLTELRRVYDAEKIR